MSTSAWIFMLAVCATITGLTLACFWKLLGSDRQFDSSADEELPSS